MPDANITKKALAQTMKDLMAKKSFSKISVGDICEACGMSRKSFYYHFQDKYDLVNWIFYTEFIHTLPLSDYSTGWDFMQDICFYFYRERAFYRKAMQIEGQNSFREYFTEVMEPFLRVFALQTMPPTEDYDFCLTFLTDAFLASITRWLSEGTPMTPEQYIQQLRGLMVGFAKRILTVLDDGEPSQS